MMAWICASCSLIIVLAFRQSERLHHVDGLDDPCTGNSEPLSAALEDVVDFPEPDRARTRTHRGIGTAL